MEDYGYVKIKLNEILEEKGISKSKLCFRAELQRTQLGLYLKNEIQRPDLGVLARICHACDCEISDLLEYIPPHESK